MKYINSIKIAVKIGRKWAMISTLSGILSAFIIWSVMTGDFIEVLLMFKESYVIAGIITAFVFSYFIGQVVAKQIVNNNKYIILKWIFCGLLTTNVSLIIPAFISASNVSEFFLNLLFNMVWFSIYGLIPILIFGTSFGSFLKNEIQKTIIL